MEQFYPMHQIKILEKDFNATLLETVDANSKYMRALNDQDFEEMKKQIHILREISTRCKEMKEKLNTLFQILEN